VNEIVLWKLNSFVLLDHRLLRQIEDLKRLKNGEHRQAKPELTALLDIHGVDLAMASTILRFRNPAVFQIIDRHAYRAVYGSDYPLHPTSAAAKKIAAYFNYVDELQNLCDRKKLTFETVDRVLYEFDKDQSGRLKGEW
jgi:thermostable 8-oxoguanine DNA glycosylase